MKIVKVMAIAVLLSVCVTAAAAETDEIIAALVQNPQLLFAQTPEDLLASGGANIITETERLHASADGLEVFAGEGENPLLTFAVPISEMLPEGAANYRAVYITCKPSAKDFGFMLFAVLNIGVTIGPESQPLVFSLADNYWQPLEPALTIEPGNVYHIFLAIGQDGMFQGALWEDGDAASAAWFALDLQTFDTAEYIDQPWELMIGFAGEATLVLQEYRYYTFDSFVN